MKFLIIANNFAEARHWYDARAESFARDGLPIPAEWQNITQHRFFGPDYPIEKIKGIMPDQIYIVGDPLLRHSAWREILRIRQRMEV
jgi:hypothetical protein